MNAKQEFIKVTEGMSIICAKIKIGYDYTKPNILAKLPVNYTKEEYNNFLNTIDVEYDSGYGSQELYGTIWCNDGIWFDRDEYDGSEWWIKHIYPEIPEELYS